MTTIFFDTETTSLQPGRICQLAYIKEDESLIGKNYYFTVGFIELSAVRTHGLTVEKLNVLSTGRGFSDFYEEIHADFSGAVLAVAHNLDFDMKFLNSEFSRAGATRFRGRTLCTMRHFTDIMKIRGKRGTYTYPSLSRLMSFLHVSSGDVMDLCRDIFGVETVSHHDARFDAAAVYLCFSRGIEMGYIKNNER